MTAEHWYTKEGKPYGAVCKNCQKQQQSERGKAKRAAKRAAAGGAKPPTVSADFEDAACSPVSSEHASGADMKALDQMRRLIESALAAEGGGLERSQVDYGTVKMAFTCTLFGQHWRIMAAVGEGKQEEK